MEIDTAPTVTEIIEAPTGDESNEPNTFDDFDSFDSVIDTPISNPQFEGGDGSQESGTSEEDSGDSEDEDASEGSTEPNKALKTITLKIDGKEVKASEDAVIVLPVDGELKEFKLSDLKTDINGREFYAKKASEADLRLQHAEKKLREVQPFLEERNRIDAALDRIQECSKKGDGFGAWVEIMRMQGKDLKAELPAFIKQTENVKANWEKKTPAERAMMFQQEELERKRLDQEKENAKVLHENKALKFETYVSKVERDSGLSRKDLDYYFEELNKIEYFARPEYKHLELDKNPERVVDVIVDFAAVNQRFNLVESAIKSVSAKHAENGAYVQKVAGIVDAIQKAENILFSKEDIEDIIKKDLGAAAPRVDVQNAEPVKASPKAVATPSKVAQPRGTPAKRQAPRTESEIPQTWGDFE